MRHVTGFPDRPPVRMNISIGDALAALHGVIGALMALHHREARRQRAGGRRRAVRSGVQHDGKPRARLRHLRRDSRGRIGTGLTNIVPSNTYATRDGHSVVIAGNGDSIYKRLMHAIGRDDLGQDPALANNLGTGQAHGGDRRRDRRVGCERTISRRSWRRSRLPTCRTARSTRRPTSSPIRSISRAK